MTNEEKTIKLMEAQLKATKAIRNNVQFFFWVFILTMIAMAFGALV